MMGKSNREKLTHVSFQEVIARDLLQDPGAVLCQRKPPPSHRNPELHTFIVKEGADMGHSWGQRKQYRNCVYQSAIDRNHTLVTSSNILGRRQAITITIAWVVDVLSKKKQRARVSVSNLREISYEFEKDHGKLHPYYATSVFNLAKALDLDNYADEAESLLREIVEICPRIFANGHPQSIIAQMNLARLTFKRGQFIEARFLMASAVSSIQECWGSDHPYTLKCVRGQAIMLERLKLPGQIDESGAACL
ncbi:hypothetical protein GJ744_011530 [Endocarpon pusillum]|uniref:Kinesin light chain n=1 Tax=Endocarpon pusillum TaxID=364733 RepID=A0A8H7AGJ2_9EURO|nr:hypothetical protein GJ744_011530 [Endocarpon pusillum]